MAHALPLHYMSGTPSSRSRCATLCGTASFSGLLCNCMVSRPPFDDGPIFFSFYAFSIKDIGQDLETMLHSDRFGLVYDSSPFHPVFHYLLPVGHPYQVPADHVNPSQWSSTWPSLLPLSSAPQELLQGRWSGIHCTWPSHCSRLCLSCSSTIVLKTHILVALLKFQLLNTFLLCICYTLPAFSSLTATSFSTLAL